MGIKNINIAINSFLLPKYSLKANISSLGREQGKINQLSSFIVGLVHSIHFFSVFHELS